MTDNIEGEAIPDPHDLRINQITFNQDASCILIACTEGVRIYNLETHQTCYKYTIGAMGLTEILFSTSLLAYVGAGEQPSLTPRKLTVLNTASNATIQDLSFASAVLAVRMNKQRLVVVLERRAFVYALHTLALLRTLDTAPNNRGLAALTPCEEPCLLMLPASEATGALRVYDLAADGCTVLCQADAHRAPLGAAAWSADGALLATASSKGTVIRVHRMPDAVKVFTFRRGTYPAAIHCMAFSPAGVEPPLLAAASSHGSVHVFRLEVPGRHPAAVAASAAAGLLSSAAKFFVSDVVDPPRNIATVRLPCHGVACVCALQAPSFSAAPSWAEREARAGSGSVVVLLVATVEGLLYEYGLSDLGNPNGPKCALEGEFFLGG